MEHIFFKKFDFIVTVLVTGVLLWTGGFTIENDAFWVFILYIISLGATNLYKAVNFYNDRKNKKKRDRFNRNHIRKSNSAYKVLPEKLKERDSACDYDCFFEVFKLMIGTYVTIILACISSIGHMQDQEFGKFALYFYVDACLLPLILALIEAFMYKQNIIQAFMEFFKSIFYKNGKFNILRGILGLVSSAILIVIALIFTMSEFVSQQSGIVVRIIILIIGCFYLVYSFYNAAKTEKK